MRSPRPDCNPSVASVLLLAEIDLRSGARRLEWAAVQYPVLERTARLAFTAAQRTRGDRLEERAA